MEERVVPGRVVPQGWRLAAALAAGLLWLAAVVALVPVPSGLRDAVLYRERSGEGLSFLEPGALVMGSLLLVGVAHLLSRRAHGTARPRVRALVLCADGPAPWVRAPRVVIAARVLTWVVLLAVLVVVSQVAALDPGPGECFRTCAPFPR